MESTERLIVHEDGSPRRRRTREAAAASEAAVLMPQQQANSSSFVNVEPPNYEAGGNLKGRPIRIVGSEDSSSWNHAMTFDGKLFLSRIKRNPDYVCIGLEVFGIVIACIALYICYFHFDLFHYHVSTVYAQLGHPHAQHLVGDKLLHGKGVDKDEVCIIITASSSSSRHWVELTDKKSKKA
jgi:hypothetical protein